MRQRDHNKANGARAVVRGAALMALLALSATSVAAAGFAGHATLTGYARASAPNPTPTPVRRAGGFNGRNVVVGQWVSATARTLTVQSFTGTVTLATTAATGFYQAVVASRSALAVGDRVTIPVSGAVPARYTAPSVTVAPPGSLFGYVLPAFGGGRGGFRPGGANGRGPAGVGRPGNRGGFGTPGLSGRVTSVQASSLTLKTARGATYTVKLATATRVYRILRVAPEQFFAGMSVTVRITTVGGQRQAVEAIQSTIANTRATLSA